MASEGEAAAARHIIARVVEEAGVRRAVSSRRQVAGDPALGAGRKTDDACPPVHEGKQGKHIVGHRNFDPLRSRLTADPAVLARRAGGGDPVGSFPRGAPGFRERIDFGEPIGVHVDPATGTESPTTVGIVHYDKQGSIHIVPARPAKPKE